MHQIHTGTMVRKEVARRNRKKSMFSSIVLPIEQERG